MKLIVSAALIATQLAAVSQPAYAAEIQREASAATGVFGGLRLRLPLDGHQGRRAPQLGLAFAPTVHTMGEDGAARMRLGEGVEFGFIGQRRAPALSIAGRRFGAAQDGQNGDDDESGIDTGEAILIGAGVIVLALGAGTIWFINEINENSE